ncbi:hypothetical protein CROQUDRAFT_98418 [Cronartium quercuum f. sp. fusiforme G11]|uniref:Uncharacterized protein n=1 Tax=Cronartium quercuum f. sp. fusiforme G11 TaxID=708437 RepID=A0A9P6N898_9BASI|nr:hypothetical protein CROQUDRAFT_98418 [Cronartium quercuum f. sp. fusiforme G11]
MHNWFEGVLATHFCYQWVFSLKVELTTQELEEMIDPLNDEDLKSGEGWLSKNVIKLILQNLQEVKSPQGLTRCPKGLGTKANGKLKASEWHALFSTHLPLAVLDIFINDYNKVLKNTTDDYLLKLLLNFCTLVECTHIVASKKIKPGDSE